MNEFKTYHPIVNFLYFVFVIGFGCALLHPVCICISFISGFTYSVILKGKKAIRKNLIYMIPAVVLTALINPLFNHEGATILGYFPGGNPLTLESVLYGICASGMLVSVICHFSCYNEVMTSDKFIYLFGKVIPAMSLIISMTLRFVPKFSAQLKVVINARKCMGCDIKKGNIAKRVKMAINVLSAMTTWSLEDAIETADSMKARGYGLPGRTAYSIFTFDKRDKKALICILVLGICVFGGIVSGKMSFEFFPTMNPAEVSPLTISVFAAYLLLCMCPVIIEFWEVRRWKALRSKI